MGRVGLSVLASSAENTRISVGCPPPIVIIRCYTLVTSGCLRVITVVPTDLAIWLHLLASVRLSSFLPSFMQRSMLVPASFILAVTCRSDALQQLSPLNDLMVVLRTVAW